MPSTQDELAGLNSDQWRDLCECAQRLKETLSEGTLSVDLRRFLPSPEASHRQAVLHELIKTELEIRYRRRQTCALEEFLHRYPELGGPEKLPASLLYEEYRLRCLLGDRPDLDEYLARFPRQFEQLSRLVRLTPPSEPMPPAPTPTANSTARPTSFGSEPAKSTDVDRAVLQELTGYEKVQRLGEGAFGEVWKALAPGGVEIALKFILSTLDHEATRRERKSLEKIKQLHHPFLLQTHSFGVFEGKLTIVMELADGSLTDRDKECKAQGLKGIPHEELLTYFGQAAAALDFLESQHVSHRDIKPENLLRLQGFAKVADFGLARTQDQTVDAASVVCGTPHFMAPEVWEQQVHRHSDQYSLAATYVDMRLGHHLFPGKMPYEVAKHHIQSEPQLDPLPAPEQAVLKRALAKDPDDRFPTCVAFAQALKDAAKEAPAAPKPAVSAQGWGVKVGIASLTCALAALLTALYFGFIHPRPALPTTPERETYWKLNGWEPVDREDTVPDRKGRRFYRRLVRLVGDQKVVVIVVPMTGPTDPETFYVMENKVSNDLYAVFMSDPRARMLLNKYSSRPGCDKLVSSEPLWLRGGYATKVNFDPEKEPFLGVDGPKGRLPVFRVTVTEAHCFAEWLDGRLPTKKQWLKAAGLGEDTRLGPFDGDPKDKKDLAINLSEDGPWPVDRGDRDLSIHLCRQMATNGKEWTRDLASKEAGAAAQIPLDAMQAAPLVSVVGKSYLSDEPLTFLSMATPDVADCTTASTEITFRVVLEP